MPAWLLSRLLPWGLLALALGIAAAVWKWDDSTVKELRADNALMQHVNEETVKAADQAKLDYARDLDSQKKLAANQVKAATINAKLKAIIKNAPASDVRSVGPLVQRYLDGMYDEDGSPAPVH